MFETIDRQQAAETVGLSVDQVEEIITQAIAGNASKRAKFVLKYILEHGACTTSELEKAGYKHPPRAVRDLKDAGVDIEMVTEPYKDPITNNQKRRGRYVLRGVMDANSRKPLTKRFSDSVKASGRCESCGTTVEKLQADHRVPFAVGGETVPHVLDEFMPLCSSCNRSKSWECEHCPNWTVKDVGVCESCYWSGPDSYDHIATRQVRRVMFELDDPVLIGAWDENGVDVKELVEDYLRTL